MARIRSVFRCTACGAASPKWVGRCPSCEAWSTLEEEVERPAAAAGSGPREEARRITEVDAGEFTAVPTGISELDRVLGGGLVPGSVSLFGGEPGVGKSTLLLQAAAHRARQGATVLYVSAEESRPQVRLRAERLGALPHDLWLVSDVTIPAITEHVETVKPELLVVDSIQTVSDPEVGSSPGSVGQVRECAHRLVELAKSRDMATVLVGHVTKDGGLAGPRVLEHLVDTVLSFEGERHHALRLLRAVKHRYGSTNELGLFEMGEAGLDPVPDASALFLADRRAASPGSVVVPVLDGFRPLLVEIQALVVPTPLPSPRRSAQGMDSGRLNLLLAVLEQHIGLVLAKSDVFASAVGGVKVGEPGADLALALALVSAAEGRALAPDLVACGEVGLAGELRQVSQLPRRLAEAARLGFTRAVVPMSAPEGPPGITLIRAATLAEAILHTPYAPKPQRPRPAGPGDC